MSSTKSTGRRKPPAQRRAEILRAASAVALSDGLEQVTARRVADQLGVYPGLISHYFPSAALLVAEAFVQAAVTERDLVYAHITADSDPVDDLRRVLTQWITSDRDVISLLWLDAWQASRRRPALLAAVTAQMEVDLERLGGLIQTGLDRGVFTVAGDDAEAAAAQILALVDGLSVQAAARGAFDTSAIQTMVIATAERLLGLAPGALAP